MCQRPKRAFFISTEEAHRAPEKLVLCQRPKRAFFISTLKGLNEVFKRLNWCQRPKRAFFISTETVYMSPKKPIGGVNALNGLSSFLQSIKCKCSLSISVSTP